MNPATISYRVKALSMAGALFASLALAQMARAEVIWLSQDRYVQVALTWTYDDQPGRYFTRNDKVAAPDFGPFEHQYQKSSIGPNWFKAQVASTWTTWEGGNYTDSYRSTSSRASVSFRLTEATPYTLKLQYNSQPIFSEFYFLPDVLRFITPIETLQFDADGYARGVLPVGDYALTLDALTGQTHVFDMDFVLLVPEPGAMATMALGALALLRRRPR
ncbi:MAG TPA: PEP-CTERM sorting domain-containing protein [Tepidisphaeraceae bacterium]|nr:PEP-CTERM sorting domain-containing protein [Tepidisphaeraceae bacterium]